MKTAISIPEEVFKAAEKMAHKMGVSRSRFISMALKSYLNRHDEDAITEKLNQIYSVQDSSLDPGLKRLQSKSLRSEDW